MDVLAQVISVLPMRHWVANSCGQFVDKFLRLTELTTITPHHELQKTLKTRQAESDPHRWSNSSLLGTVRSATV